MVAPIWTAASRGPFIRGIIAASPEGRPGPRSVIAAVAAMMVKAYS
jgi:hypothetical protein